MIDLFQNSTVHLMGLWVAVSCLSGLLVFIVVKVFDSIFSNQSSFDRYHKSIVGLVFFFLLNIAGTYYFHEYIITESETSISVDFTNTHQLSNKPVVKDTGAHIVQANESKTKEFFTSNMIFKLLGIFWLLGAVVFTIKLVGGYFYTQSLIQKKQKSIPQKWNHFIDQQLERLGIKKQIKVFESLKVTSAFTFGFVKPVIALPLGFFTTLPSEQIEAVLLHELYHIKHKDYLINLLTMTFEVIFFYHPVMWWLAKSIRRERENRCDDQVTQIADKQVYAHALLNMESYRQSMNYAIPFSNKQSNLKMRIMRIFEQKPEQNIGLKPFLSLLMIVVFLMGFTFYKLEEPKNLAKHKENIEPKNELDEKSIPQEPEYDVLFKTENSRLGVVLEMTEKTLIAKSENGKVKLYIDEELHPLNKKISMGESDIATMYKSDEELAYYFFSRKYFESHDRTAWEKENENRNSYIFDRDTEFFIFKPAQKFDSKSANDSDMETEDVNSLELRTSKSISKIEQRVPNTSGFNIYGPIQLQFKNNMSQVGDTNNLEVLKKLVRKFSSDENTEVSVKIDGKLTPAGTNLEKILGKREIRNIRIVLPSENAGKGLIEIITDDIVEMSVEEVAANGENSKAIIEDPENDNTIAISVLNKTKDVDSSDEKEMDVKKESVLKVLGLESSEILFVIDGEEKRIGYKPNDIDPNKIDSITVLKDKKATEKYGDKAKNGVVEIYLKKE
ncbi:MAG: M56 family metallopeptidase [Bacteroidota bacterium]